MKVEEIEVKIKHIQRNWRGFRIRKKVMLFSKLPNDIWSLILTKIKAPSILYRNIDNLINIKIVRYYWQPPGNTKNKLRILSLSKKYCNCLQKSTIYNVLKFSLFLLDIENQHTNNNNIYITILNSIIEHLLNVFEAKFYKAQ